MWDGKERRDMDLELRDKIIETHTNVFNLVNILQFFPIFLSSLVGFQHFR